MSVFSELHAEMMEDDSGMMECTYAHEEQAFHNAVNEVKSFIEQGAISYDEVEKLLRGGNNG